MRSKILLFIFALCLLISVLALSGCEPTDPCPTDCTCKPPSDPPQPTGPPPCISPDAL